MDLLYISSAYSDLPKYSSYTATLCNDIETYFTFSFKLFEFLLFSSFERKSSKSL